MIDIKKTIEDFENISSGVYDIPMADGDLDESADLLEMRLNDFFKKTLLEITEDFKKK